MVCMKRTQQAGNMKQVPMKRINFFLDIDYHEQMKKIAIEKRSSVSTIVRELVRDYVNRECKKKKG